MNTSPFQIAVVVLAPTALAALVWLACGRRGGMGGVVGRFLLGALAAIPCGAVGRLIEVPLERLTGHYYADAFTLELLATAIPEELGKGLAALFFLLRGGAAGSARAWLVCGAAAHFGFAAMEGLFSALGNEGILKVVVGRSLGAISHGCWGIIMAWFAWRAASSNRGRWPKFAAALLVPALLHALLNASQVEVPGASGLAEDQMPPVSELLIVFSGIGSLLASIIFASRCLVLGRRADRAAAQDH